MYKNIALILAGGSGSRINQNIPKQFIDIFNKPVIGYTLEVFNSHKEIDAIVIVVSSGNIKRMEEIVNNYKFNKVVKIVSGGKNRQQSSYFGLQELRKMANEDTVVLIHDAARALVTEKIVSDNIALSRVHGAVTTAVATSDTILKSENGNVVSEILSRDKLYLVQTPQSFIYKKIMLAHEKALNMDREYTDDSGLYTDNSFDDVFIVEGNKLNFKITVDDDLEIFKAVVYNKLKSLKYQ